MAITVTATATGVSPSNGVNVRIFVFTGAKAAASQAGVTASQSAAAAHQATINTAAGSEVAGSLFGVSSFTFDAGSTSVDNINDATNGVQYGSFKSTASGSRTVGASAPTTAGGMAALEIQAATTLAHDASETGVLTTNKTGTSAVSPSFTPPPGSLVVAVVSLFGIGTVATASVTDTSGMTWTEKIAGHASGMGYAGIWIAQVPSGVNVNLTTPNLALAAPLAGPGGGVGLTTPNLALAAPLVAPSAGGTPANVNLTAPNLSLAAPIVAPQGRANVALTTPTLSLSAPLVTPPIAPGTFPDSPLGVRVEINAGGWKDISPYVAIADAGAALTITYGRADASQQTNPTTAAMKWNNTDARFSPRNPLGPYYPALGRNTPVRVSIPSDFTHLRIADDNTSFVSAPDSAGLSITGSLEIDIELELTDWRLGTIVSKYSTTSNQRSWFLLLDEDGTLSFTWSSNGTNGFTARSTIPLPVVSGHLSIVVTFDATTGNVVFYTGGAAYAGITQLGSTVPGTGATSIFDSTAPVQICYNSQVWTSIQGRVYNFYLKDGSAVTKASADFTQATPGASSMTDSQGNVWTLSGTAEFSNRDYKFYGEAAALPQQWERDDIWTPVSAAGVLRRLGQSSAALDSPMKRGYLRLAPVPVAYWPCEDGTTSTQIAAAIGGQAMTFNGTPNFSSNSDFVCSQAIPVLNGSVWTAFVPPYSGGTDIVMRFLMEVPAAGETDGDLIAMVHSSGTVRTFQLKYKSGGGLEITGFASDGSQLFDQTSAFAVNGELLRVSLELRQIGGNIQYSVATLLVGAANGAGISGTIAGTLGHATQIHINPGGGLNNTAVGHVSVQSVWASLFDLASELDAFQGEAAGDRFARLCAEESLNCRIYGPSRLTRIMGAQSVDTFINLLQECENADNGMIFEPMDTLGLGYRTSRSMVAQSAAVALDYAADHVSPPLSPTDDDLYTSNDVTASRPNGSSARAFLNDGSPMSVSSPPNGVGPYVTFATVNVNADSMLNDNANWLLHIGTVNEERYPQMKVDLAATSPAIVALFRPVLGVRVGDVVTVDNVPSFLPPDGINVIVWGNTLVIGDFVCNTVWQTQPASPYNVFVAGTGRADTNGSTLHANATSGATSITVDTQAGSALWTTNAGDWPFDILVGGERMTVTHISGTAGTQTFTVTRAVNGIAKAHLAGDSVNLFSPCYYALS